MRIVSISAALLLAFVLGCSKKKNAERSAPPAADMVALGLSWAPKIQDPLSRARFLVGMAEQAAALGKPSFAGGALAAAHEAAREEADPEVHALLQMRLALAHQAQGAGEVAIKVAGAISNPKIRSEAQAALVAKIVSQGGRPEALAASITDPSQKAKARLHLVEAVIRAGKLSEAGRAAAKISAPRRRSEAIAMVATAHAKAGRFVAARTAVEALSDAHWRAEAQSALAAAYLMAGRRKRARATALAVESDWIRARTLAQLALLRGRSGARLWKQAEAIADDISDGVLRASAQADVATRLYQAGQTKRALALIDRIAVGGTRDKALAKMVAQDASGGRDARLPELMRRLKDPVYSAQAKRAIAMAHVSRGEYEKGLEVALEIFAPEFRMPLAGAICVAHRAKQGAMSPAMRAALATALGVQNP